MFVPTRHRVAVAITLLSGPALNSWRRYATKPHVRRDWVMFRIRMNLAFGAQGDEDDWEEIASSFRQRPLETSAQYSVRFVRCVIDACPVVQADSTFRHLYLRGLRTDCKCALLLNGCTSFGMLRERVESFYDLPHPAPPPPRLL